MLMAAFVHLTQNVDQAIVMDIIANLHAFHYIQLDLIMINAIVQ
jgi:hypothetical protein